MKPLDASECQVQILVCTNERPEGKSCCKRVGGQEFYDRLKAKLKQSTFAGTHWVSRTGCLGFCNNVGTTVVIHPKGRDPLWFSEVKDEDFDRIWEEIVRV